MYQFTVEDFDSQNLFKELSVLTPKVRDAMFSGIYWLNEHKINAVLIGGVAVANYLAVPRPLTPDIDFLVSDLDTVEDKLEEAGIKYHSIIAQSGAKLGITITSFNMDLVDTNSWFREMQVYVIKTANIIRIAGIPVKVINPEMLTLLKLCLGRDKDDNDATLLFKSPLMSKLKFLEIIERFEDKIDTINFKLYAEMINENK